jgi:5'-3' exonuclease
LSDADMVVMEDAYRQFDEIREEILPYLGFNNSFRQTGYEADDLIGWVSMRIPADYMIISADADLLQLLVDSRYCPVRLYNFKAVTDAKQFSDSLFGIRPIRYGYVKAIAGCDGDCVKGIVGIGEITAAKYVAGVLPDGVAKSKIESKEGKKLAQENMRLVSLPFNTTDQD